MKAQTNGSLCNVSLWFEFVSTENKQTKQNKTKQKKQTKKQTNKLTDKQTKKQTNKQISRQTNKRNDANENQQIAKLVRQIKKGQKGKLNTCIHASEVSAEGILMSFSLVIEKCQIKVNNYLFFSK